MDTILVILVLAIVAATVYYFEFYKKGKINDKDGDFIPDEIEDAVEEIKELLEDVKEKKRRGRKPKAKK